MTRYLARRLLHGVALLFLISALCFTLFQLAPGNYADAVRLDPRVSAETVARMRVRDGLDRSLPWRYVAWLTAAFRGEFGFSLAYGLPVGRLLLPRVENTLLLSASAALFAWPAALLIGIGAAVSRRRTVRHFVTVSMSILVSLPELLVALALLLFAVRSGLFPVTGMTDLSPAGGGFDALIAHLALPVLALVLVSLPLLVRHIEVALREALQSPSVRAARTHGIPRRRVVLVYALPAAANPLISILGLSIGTLLSSSLIVEIVMGWPGLGPLVLDAVLSRDSPIVIAATLLSGAMFVLGNLVADLLFYVVDPRIRRTP